MSIPETQPLAGQDLAAHPYPFKTTLKLLATLLLSPLFLIVALAGFLVVLADFTWFRAREFRYGHPEPKGLWEF